MGEAKNSEICAKIIYSVFNATFEIGEFIEVSAQLVSVKEPKPKR
jgi:hypothetical protein